MALIRIAWHQTLRDSRSLGHDRKFTSGSSWQNSDRWPCILTTTRESVALLSRFAPSPFGSEAAKIDDSSPCLARTLPWPLPFSEWREFKKLSRLLLEGLSLVASCTMPPRRVLCTPQTCMHDERLRRTLIDSILLAAEVGVLFVILNSNLLCCARVSR